MVVVAAATNGWKRPSQPRLSDWETTPIPVDARSCGVAVRGNAAIQLGNSESMIRTHYFNRMTMAEAEAFYAIAPKV
jgi:hypothetical protein